MNKKLTEIFLTVLLLLIGKSQAVTLTQALGDNYIYVEVDSGQQITLNFNNNANYTFTNWTVESGNVTVDTTNPTITFTMPNIDVVIRGNYAEATGGYSCECGVCEETVDTEGDYCDNCQGGCGCGACSCERNICDSCGECEVCRGGWCTDCGYCWDCCTCEFYCDSCLTTLYRNDICFDCGCCWSCCSCDEVECGACGMWTSGICSDCGVCFDCCSCGEVECESCQGYYSICEGCKLCVNCCICVGEYKCACADCNFFVNTEGDNCIYCWNCDSCGECYYHQAGGGCDCGYCVECCCCCEYTLMYDENGGSGAPSSETCVDRDDCSPSFTVSAVEPKPPTGKVFMGWATSSTAVDAEYEAGDSISISAELGMKYSSTTLYAVYTIPLSSGTLITEADVGAYVTYRPSQTSYTVSATVSGYYSDQTYNPSSITSWRMFSIDGQNAQIISDGSVGTLYLKGTTGYINAVQTLQDMSSAYVNSTYAESGRSLGYSEQGLTDIANYKVINTNTYPLSNSASGFPYTDNQFESDTNILNEYKSLCDNGFGVWLASREMITFPFWDMGVMRVFSGAYASSTTLYRQSSSGGDPWIPDASNGVRPVITLKSGVTVTGGNGTKSDPYTITIQ